MLDASMLQVMGEEPVASLTPMKEAMLLGVDQETQEDQVTALIPPSDWRRLLSLKMSLVWG